MKLKKNYKAKLIVFAVAFVAIYLGFFGDHNLYRLFKLKRQEKALRAELAESRSERERLRNEIEKLTNDPAYIEKVAREEFRMGRKGEKIFIIKDKDSQ